MGVNNGTIGANTYFIEQSGTGAVGVAIGSGSGGSVAAKAQDWFNNTNILGVLNTGEGAGLWGVVSDGIGGYNATLINNANYNLAQNLAGETHITGSQGGEVIDQVIYGNLANGNYYDGYTTKLLPDGPDFTIDLKLDFGDFGKVDYLDVVSGDDIDAVKAANLAKIEELMKLVNDKLAHFTGKSNDLSAIDIQQKNAISNLGSTQSSSNTISPLALLTFADSLQKLVQAQMDQYLGSLSALLNLGAFPTSLLSGATTRMGTLSKNSTTYYPY